MNIQNKLIAKTTELQDLDNNPLLSDTSDVSDTDIPSPDENFNKEKDQENKNGSIQSIFGISRLSYNNF